jgi:hypothetical protein
MEATMSAEGSALIQQMTRCMKISFKSMQIHRKQPKTMNKSFSPEYIGQLIREIKGHYLGEDAALNPTELQRISVTTQMIPRAPNDDATLVDVGGWIPWIPVYRELGYRHVIIVQPYGSINMLSGLTIPGLDDFFEVRICEADAEKDAYAIESSIASTVTCFEVLEHLFRDPMHLFGECNRLLCKQGVFCLTTPNVLWRMNLFRYMFGEHPFMWSVFTGMRGDRHNREYTPAEVSALGDASGFMVDRLYTDDTNKPTNKLRWAAGTLFSIPGCVSGRVEMKMRNQTIFARFRKQRSVIDRYPPWLYEFFGKNGVQ